MFGSRRRLQEQLADRTAQLEDLREKYNEVLEERDAVIKRNRALVVEAAEADAAAQRTDTRNRLLTELLEKARAAQGNEEYGRLEIRHERAVRAAARYLEELWQTRQALAGQRHTVPVVPGQGEPLPEGGRVQPLSSVAELLQCREARRQLEKRLADLQAANESRAPRVAL